MRTLLLFLMASFIFLTSSAQFKVIEHGTYENPEGGTEDLSNTVIPENVFLISQDHELLLWIINETSSTYTTRVIRTEIDVTPETTNTTCWGNCPPNVDAGEIPVWTVGGTASSYVQTLAPGDTNRTFVAHHNAMGILGCSQYRFDVVNEDDHTEVLTSFDILFDHNGQGSCVTSIEDISLNLVLSLAPNPAREYVDITMEGIDLPIEIVISDLLGQQVAQRALRPMEKQVERINTAEMRNGVYFLSVLAEGQMVRTSKFIVSH